MEVRGNSTAFVSRYKQSVQVVRADLHSGVHDEAGDMDGASLAHAVRPPHSLLQDGGVHAGLQQEHMVGCMQTVFWQQNLIGCMQAAAAFMDC